MGATVQFVKLPKVTDDTQRVYVHWYRHRWTYVHAAWHRCGIKRTDGRNRYFWLALGPFDLRIHV